MLSVGLSLKSITRTETPKCNILGPHRIYICSDLISNLATIVFI